MTGYRNVFRAAGINPANVPVYETLNEPKSVVAGLEAIFAGKQPTALLCMSYRVAMIAIDWLKARGPQCPPISPSSAMTAYPIQPARPRRSPPSSSPSPPSAAAPSSSSSRPMARSTAKPCRSDWWFAPPRQNQRSDRDVILRYSAGIHGRAEITRRSHKESVDDQPRPAARQNQGACPRLPADQKALTADYHAMRDRIAAPTPEIGADPAAVIDELVAAGRARPPCRCRAALLRLGDRRLRTRRRRRRLAGQRLGPECRLPARRSGQAAIEEIAEAWLLDILDLPRGQRDRLHDRRHRCQRVCLAAARNARAAQGRLGSRCRRPVRRAAGRRC